MSVPSSIPSSSRDAACLGGLDRGRDSGVRARVAVVIVTFNRKGYVDTVLKAVARQAYPVSLLDVVIVDNAGTDGTLAAVVDGWMPERVIENRTVEALRPAFDVVQHASARMNRGGFGSLTIVRNQANLGGCGGFNTGLKLVEAVIDGEVVLRDCAADVPERLWLLDDDVDLPEDALERLMSAMDAEERVAVVGSRMADINDRGRTYETTIYLESRTGQLSPWPHPTHRLLASHQAWEREVGGVHGRRVYSGVREVDVVAACSMLVRWDAVRQVGFWDDRFFIYCDDADWCLRMGRAGWKVVLSLDAVVYHVPWVLKSTPERMYYSHRNSIWMAQKNFRGSHLRRVMASRLKGMLRDSLRAMVMRREFHAEILRRTVADAVTSRGGKLDIGNGPKPMPLKEGLVFVGALEPGATVALMCSQTDSLNWAMQVRDRLREQLSESGMLEREPRWLLVMRNDVPGHEQAGDEDGGWARRVVYNTRWASRLKKQLWLLRERPRACVVFENTNDMLVLTGRGNVHVDLKDASVCQAERDGWGVRGVFVLRWMWTAMRAGWFVMTCTRAKT